MLLPLDEDVPLTHERDEEEVEDENEVDNKLAPKEVADEDRPSAEDAGIEILLLGWLFIVPSTLIDALAAILMALAPPPCTLSPPVSPPPAL